MVNKKGWIKIVEASVSVILVLGVIIFVLSSSNIKSGGQNSEIYNAEEDILRTIQLNNSLRNDILETNGIIEWNNFPNSIQNIIYDKTPAGFECIGKICGTEDLCNIDFLEKRNIYTQSVLITSNLTLYNPRVLKIFCWEK